MRFFLKITLMLFFTASFCQEVTTDTTKIKVDSLYREDQFYVNITYNNIQNAPKGLSQSRFSPGFGFGFLRDMPINKKRNVAIALGLGYSSSTYYNNLYITEANDGSDTKAYEVLSGDIFYDKNKMSLHYLDIPLEIRWRNSTYDSHKFWRIYTGLKLSYLINDNYKFVNDVQNFTITNNSDFNKFQYSIYLTAGWNTWNFYASYGINSLFKSAKIGNDPINMRSLNIGLQFYIL